MILEYTGSFAQFSSRLSPRYASEYTRLRRRVSVSPVSLLLVLLGCYIVFSRLGPVVSRAGNFAIETFEVEKRILAEFDSEGLTVFREVISKLKVITRAPSPVLLLGRSSSDSILVVAMGNNKSKSKTTDSAPQDTPKESPTDEGQTKPVAEYKEVADLMEDPSGEGEGAGEGGEGEGGGDVFREGGEGGVTGPPPTDRRLADIRKDSELSLHSMGSTMSLTKIGKQDRLNPADYEKKRVKFKILQPTIRTGDLALLYRRGQTAPNVAIFVNHSDSDPLFPLLLVKGKTKPLSLDKFDACKPRFIHPITATTRIFYGDYEKVTVRYVHSDEEISAEEAMEAVDKVERIPFSVKEKMAIESAQSDAHRSLLICTFMAAYYYRELGVFKDEPDSITPESFLEHLNLSEPIEVKLPTVKYGPMVHGEPPYLKQLVDGIRPRGVIQLQSYEDIVRGLDTGDLVFFSGATSQGAIIKFFDNSEFSHIALILKAKFTSQLLIWEASTNHARLVDVQSGHVQTGVEVLPMRNKVFSGWYDLVAVRRLIGVTTEQREKLYNIMLELRKEWMGRPYEKNMVQLAVSAINPSDMFMSLFQNTHEDLSSLFCSELVAAAYQRMGLIHNDRPSNTYTPDDFSSSRDHKILKEGVQLSPEEYISLKFPPVVLSPQDSVY